MSKFFKYFLVLITLTLPRFFVLAEGLIPCGTSLNPQTCQFSDFFELISRVVDFLLFKITIPIGAIVIIYGGMIMVIYASNSGEREKGKKAIMTAVKGLLLVLGAFVIVKFILITLTGNSDLLII